MRDQLGEIAGYGAQVPDDYGGLYIDGSTVVVQFVRDLDRHAAAVRGLVSDPARVRVECTSRSWSDVMAAKERVAYVLLSEPALGVTSVGIALRDRRFTVVVGADPCTPEQVGAIRAAVDGDEVAVEAQGPARFVAGASDIDHSA